MIVDVMIFQSFKRRKCWNDLPWIWVILFIRISAKIFVNFLSPFVNTIFTSKFTFILSEVPGVSASCSGRTIGTSCFLSLCFFSLVISWKWTGSFAPNTWGGWSWDINNSYFVWFCFYSVIFSWLGLQSGFPVDNKESYWLVFSFNFNDISLNLSSKVFFSASRHSFSAWIISFLSFSSSYFDVILFNSCFAFSRSNFKRLDSNSDFSSSTLGTRFDLFVSKTALY